MVLFALSSKTPRLKLR